MSKTKPVRPNFDNGSTPVQKNAIADLVQLYVGFHNEDKHAVSLQLAPPGSPLDKVLGVFKEHTDVPLQIPIAHGEGRFYAEENVLNDLEKNDQVIFRYCDEKGDIHINVNPNGAVRNIAGIRNKNGNVFGMMPHPERAVSSQLKNIDGLRVFELLGLN